MDQAEKSKLYTYEDYVCYPEGERLEIIDGQVYAMVPAPSRIHQELITELVTLLNNHIKASGGGCKVYAAPFDVILTDSSDMNNSRNVVQPDISIICDRSKLSDNGCIGSPDMIIEIVSPYNPTNDYIRKLSLYSRYQIREYWIVNPLKKNVLVYKLDDSTTPDPDMYSFKDRIPIGIFNGFLIDFNDFSLE